MSARRIVLADGQPLGDERDALLVAAVLGGVADDRPLGLYETCLARDLAARRGDPSDLGHRALVQRLVALADEGQARKTFDPKGL